MARGWESKSVEAQIEESQSRARERHVALSPEELKRQRELDSLRMSRTKVMHDLSVAVHPRYRESLEAALAFLENKIQALS